MAPDYRGSAVSGNDNVSHGGPANKTNCGKLIGGESKNVSRAGPPLLRSLSPCRPLRAAEYLRNELEKNAGSREREVKERVQSLLPREATFHERGTGREREREKESGRTTEEPMGKRGRRATAGQGGGKRVRPR